MILYYQQILGHDSHIFSGKEYIKPPGNINGHPFLFSDQWYKGNLILDDKVFFDIDMKLDIHQKVLILKHHDHEGYEILLQPDIDRIKAIQLYNKNIIILSGEQAAAYHIPEGIYEQIYHGASKVLIRYKKEIDSEIRFAVYLHREYAQSMDFYLLNKGQSYLINKKRAMLKALKDHKKDINKFIKSNYIYYSEKSTENIIRIISYYDSLDL
jgi:hypothetical protein